MGAFASLLLSISGSIAMRILLALGITFGSYASLDIATEGMISLIQQHYNSVSVNVLALINLAGFGQAMGIILGGYVTKVALKALNVFAMKIPL